MALTTVRPEGMGFNTGRRNLIINGAMQVAQRGTSATVSDQSNEGYSTLDRWRTNFNNALGGAISFSQSTDAPSGFANSLKVQCSTADTSLSTNEYLSIHQRIEAQNLQLLGYGTSDAKAMTLSWQMKTETYTGPISVAFETADGTVEYYTKSYTPTTSWATYTCTVPASTSATINDDTGLGMYVRFVLAGHSSSSIAASSDSTAWSTTRADYRSDVGNILSSTSNAIYITGVQLEIGENASDFEHRSYAEELALCKRYYVRHSGNIVFGVGQAYSTSQMIASVPLQVEMRAGPSLAHQNIFIRNATGNSAAASALSISNQTKNFVELLGTRSGSGLTAGNAAQIRINTTSDYIDFIAEL